MDRVAAPPLLLVRVDARQAVEARLDRPQQAVERGSLAVIEREEPAAHRLGDREQKAHEDDDEKPSLKGHGTPPLKAFGPCEHGDEIDEKADRGGAREP